MSRPIIFRDQQHNKGRAWSRVAWEIEKGNLVKPSLYKCLDCGKRASEYDHYLGYSDEHVLHVQPVCKSCNAKRAYQRGESNQRLTGLIGPVQKYGHFFSSTARNGKDTNNHFNRNLIGPRTKDGRFITAHGRERK